MAFKLTGLADVLRSAGLTVVETPGWKTRGYAGQDLIEIRGVLHHHTATNRQRFNDSDAPTLSMCVNGRSDLAGPLCNIVFGRNGTVYLVAAGVANHAGAGSAHNVPANMGNHYLIGIEMESSGIAPWDWTPDQLRVAPYLGAALERAYGIDLQIAHYEYSSQGKIDPAGWPGGMDGLRASINAVLAGPSMNLASTGITTQSTQEEDEDMPSAQEIAAAVWGFKNPALDSRDMRQIVADIQKDVPVGVWSYSNPSVGGGDAYQILRDAVANTDRIAADVATVAAKEAAAGASEDQIKEAVKTAISESIVNVDVSVGGK
jgi:hypothetical protein